MTLENRQVESMHVRDTEWFRAARWGVFMHFLTDAATNADEWNRKVDGFDVDANLISYFDEDVTKLKMPTLSDFAVLNDAPADLDLYEPPTLAERKAADPDRTFEWKDGVLRCPVRPHDFRLFEFRMIRRQP